MDQSHGCVHLRFAQENNQWKEFAIVECNTCLYINFVGLANQVNGQGVLWIRAVLQIALKLWKFYYIRVV